MTKDNDTDIMEIRDSIRDRVREDHEMRNLNRMKDVERIMALSRECCFSVWYEPENGRYYTDTEKPTGSIWICDVDREISKETLGRMTQLMLQVTEEYKQKGYLKE